MSKAFDKNRLQRLKILDSVLSESKDGYPMSRLTKILTDKLGVDIDRFKVTRDLKFLQDVLGVSIVNEPREVDINGSFRQVEFWKYLESGSSIFSASDSLTEDERVFLARALEMLGLKGISNSKIFTKLKLKANTNREFISFTKNPLEKSISNIFDRLRLHIQRQEVVSFKVRNRKTGEKTLHHVHPWYLREYNRRWYLLGYEDREKKIDHYCLDRISSSTRILAKQYISPTVSIEDILKDVIGISLPIEEPVEIIFWVSDESIDFVSNKPLHSSQQRLSDKDIEVVIPNAMRLNGGGYFKIFCKINYELIRELMSFGEHLIALTPNEVRGKIKERLSKMTNAYVP